MLVVVFMAHLRQTYLIERLSQSHLLYFISGGSRRWSVDFDQRLLKNDHRDFNCLISMKPSLSTTQACTISTKVGMIFLVLLEKVVGPF